MGGCAVYPCSSHPFLAARLQAVAHHEVILQISLSQNLSGQRTVFSPVPFTVTYKKMGRENKNSILTRIHRDKEINMETGIRWYQAIELAASIYSLLLPFLLAENIESHSPLQEC